MKMINPIDFITALRESDVYIKYIYTEGGCYQFHLLLSKLYKGCTPLMSSNEDHVVTEIDGILYDINGIANPDTYRIMGKSDIEKARKWSFHRNNLLKLSNCPTCDEPLYFEHSE